jgi:surface antigen
MKSITVKPLLDLLTTAIAGHGVPHRQPTGNELHHIAPAPRSKRTGVATARLTATVSVLAATVAMLVPAGAAQAVTGFHTSGSGVRVRAGASTATTQVSTIAATGTAIDIACQTSGVSITAAGYGTSTVWDKLNGYAYGYISDLFVRETLYAQFDPRIPRCKIPPAPPAPAAYPYPVGSKAASNTFPAGQCTWGAEQQWNLHFHSYLAVRGNALSWASSAAANGWTVKASPAVPVANGSLAVFQPGTDGALKPYGHVAWIVAVSGSRFEILEMNGPAGAYRWDYRWVNNAGDVSFIYW